MKKPILNLWIDVISLVVFTSMISTGLLLKFVLPPGSGRMGMGLAARGREHHTIALYMGLTRHEWGAIHFYISLVFLVLLTIHLALHWNWVVCMLWGPRNPPSKQRKYLTFGLLFVMVVILSIPWIGQVFGQKYFATRTELNR